MKVEMKIRNTDIIASLNFGTIGDFLWWNDLPHNADSTVKQSFLFGLCLLKNEQNKWGGVQFYLLNINALIVFRTLPPLTAV